MIFPHSIGVYIESDWASIVLVKLHFRTLRIVDQKILPLSPEKKMDERVKEIKHALKEVIQKHRLADPIIHLGIPRAQSILKFIDFPVSVKENLKETLAYEMEKYVPFTENDIYFDYQIVFEDKIKGRINVLLAVVKKEIVLPYLKIMEGVPGDLAGIDISSNAIANFFEIRNKTLPHNFGVVYGSGNILEFSGIRKSLLQYSKYINTSVASDDYKEKVSSELISMIDKLAVKDDQGVFKIIFCVKDASEELIGRLRETVDQHIVRAEDLGNVISDSVMIPAYGLSIKGLQKASMNMNFLPASLQRKPGKIGIYSFYILICSMCLALGLWGGGLFLKKQQAVNQLQTAIDNIQQELGQMTAVTLESQKIQKRIDFLKSFPIRDGRLIDIINELSQRIPETAWINSFNYSNGKLKIEGYAKNASELIPLIEASSHFNGVTFLSTIRKDSSGQENFTIGLDVDASSAP